MTPFRMTDHARFEAARRGITLERIASTIEAPESVVAGAGGRSIYQKRIVFAAKTYLVRVVVESGHEPPVVVTVYRTSKMEKYLQRGDGEHEGGL
ncbi:DUF4258 domain-containing protein [Hydrogenophilus thermoluteolus]|jgi:hypothetical protein|uniref:DUF4258 domain-containing protein n=2 Tax=Hydrogenophilus thermoluteolus TaxID=297 RepID=A0A2Z6E0H6_HYDTE|nr:DUF4258 domain-containing protein [Hydrogenophilus thermoluteolus]MBW7656946.1 DUF4258 domain-containing protein [Hydrogenophilus thermoluteolus]BBD78291.1 hypothetical protein HPTL_2037 [Hydrogenophilus thermoluteolus]